MRAHEIIRSVLDLIDQIENPQTEPVALAIVEPELKTNPYDDEQRRFNQILDLLTQPEQMYNNSPAETVADADSVTKDAGGGWNGPKHPADIRADSVAMYPNYIHKPGA